MSMPDLLIVGGGAAGLMAAGAAAARGLSVTVLEHNPKGTGQKILITGKGRCNLTNDCDVPELLPFVRRNPRFLYSALYAFPPAAAMELFESLGVPLKTERGRRVFPQSDHATDVLEALRRYAADARVLHGSARRLCIEDGRCTGVETSDGRALHAKAVLVATGGVSYPATGSTGEGHRMAREAGHTVTPLRGSLVPLRDYGLGRTLQGLSLRNVGLTVFEDKKKIYTDFGELLFTHFGVSGPLVLSASAHMRHFDKKTYRLEIDLKPALDEQALDKRLLRDFEKYANHDFCNALDDLLPQKLIGAVVERTEIPPHEKVHDVTREQRRRLGQVLKHFSVDIAGPCPVTDAIVTSGGVKIGEIDPKTMASKLVKGLYFAGEIMDVDAYTGGFNLQIAWATGRAAGMAAAEQAPSGQEEEDT